jgi:hypothetical protein
MAATFGGSGANGATPWGDTGYTGPYVTNQQANSILGQNYSAPNNDSISFSDPGQVFPTLNYGGASTPSPAPTGGAVFGGTSPSAGIPMPKNPVTQGSGAVFGGTATNGGASGVGGISGYTAGQNPYLQQMGDALVQQNTQNFNRNVMPRIASQAMAAGGYGGSRQGVVEANAMNDLNMGNANALASLYGNGYNTALQYDLGRRGNDLGYYSATNQNNQAMGNLGLGYANLDRSINNDNLSWQQQGYNNNMGLFGQLMNNNQTGISAGTNIQNTPMNYWSQFGNQYNSIGQGYGTSTASGGGGNPIMGALGGAQLGSQVANWWNRSPNAVGGTNSQGFGTGSGYGNQDLGMYF